MAVAIPYAMAAFAAYSTYSQASAQKNQANYNAAVERNNALISGMQAKDALERGKLERQAHERKVRATIGQQEAGLAKNGLSLSSGSAANILSDTELFGLMDSNTITQDSKRKAWAYDVEGANHNAQAQGLENQADSINPMMSGLIAGGMSLGASWGAGKLGSFGSGGGSGADVGGSNWWMGASDYKPSPYGVKL
jgi:hypothetical protein